MAIKAIIFDIDGVLADSRKAIVHNTKTLMAEFGFAVEKGAVEGMSSAHSADTVLLRLAPDLERDPQMLSDMLRRLSELTKENLHVIRPAPLVKSIPALARKYKLGTATNRKGSAKLVLEMFGVAKHFGAIVTSLDADYKPSPDMVLLACERLGVKPSEAVFVGDNYEDKLSGEAAGVRFVMMDGNDLAQVKKFLAEFLPKD